MHNRGTVGVCLWGFLRVFKVEEYIRVAFTVLVRGGAAAVADVRVHVYRAAGQAGMLKPLGSFQTSERDLQEDGFSSPL